MKFVFSSVFGRVLLPLLTTVYFVDALRLTPWGESEEVSVSFFPIVLSIMMYATLAFMFWQDWLGRKSESQDWSQIADPLKVVGLTAVYILAFKSAGYVVATTLYVYGLLFIFRYVQERPWKAILVSLVITGIFYLFFGVAFNIRLPKLAGVL